MNLLSSNNDHSNLLGNLGNIIGDSNGFSTVTNMGAPIIKMLFGNKLDGILDLVAGNSGIKKSSASGLMSLVAPVAMGLISNKVKSDGLGISGLANFLMGQAGSIKNALPAGFTSQLGFSKLGDFLGDAKDAVNVPTSGGGLGKFFPWLIGLAALLAALYFLRTCNKESMNETVTTTVDTTMIKANAAVDTAKAAITGFMKKLSSGFELANAATDGIESQLIGFIEDNTKVVDKTTWFNFDHLLFETGKATLMPESDVQLKNIAEIMKAFPNVKIKIGGYTDNDGDPKFNMKLSAERATNVMNALANLGVEKPRMAAEGYGKEHPVCPANDTPECKQQNRRIAVRVTEK
jgi:outer membrane protein OmpA-like peptidoglycan-associated protein